MELFTKLSEVMGQGTSVTISVSKTATGMAVSVLPANDLVKDAAKNKIVPLSVVGTAEELDLGFVDAVCKPVEIANGFYASVKEFEASVEKAKEESAMKKKAAEDAKKSAESFLPYYNLAKKNFDADKFNDAMSVLDNLEENVKNMTDAHKKLVTDLRDSISKKQGESGLFGSTYEDKSDGAWLKA